MNFTYNMFLRMNEHMENDSSFTYMVHYGPSIASYKSFIEPLLTNVELHRRLVKIAPRFDSEEFMQWLTDYDAYRLELGNEKNKKKRAGIRQSDPVKRFRGYILELMSGHDDHEIDPTSVPYDLVYTALTQLEVKLDDIHDMLDTLEDTWDVDFDNVDETTSDNAVAFIEKMEDLAKDVVEKVKQLRKSKKKAGQKNPVANKTNPLGLTSPWGAPVGKLKKDKPS